MFENLLQTEDQGQLKLSGQIYIQGVSLVCYSDATDFPLFLSVWLCLQAVCKIF